MSTEKFDKDKYYITEKFTSVKRSNLLLLLVLLPLYAVGVFVYILQQGDYANIFLTVFERNITFLVEILILGLAIFLFIAIALIVKAILLSVFSEGKFESVKFKIIKDAQKPYCCLAEPIKVWQYQLCIAVYILIAAIIPYIIALILGDFIYILASFISMLFAGADILFLIFLFGAKKDSYVLDFEGIILYRLYEKNTDFIDIGD